MSEIEREQDKAQGLVLMGEALEAAQREVEAREEVQFIERRKEELGLEEFKR